MEGFQASLQNSSHWPIDKKKKKKKTFLDMLSIWHTLI